MSVPTRLSAFGVRLIVGNVRGKGLDAVRTAATALRSFRQSVSGAPDLATLVEQVMRETTQSLAESSDFITALFVEFTPSGELLLANLGHPAPLHLGLKGLRSLDPSIRSRPLGLGPAPVIDEFSIESGDRILFYTDGLSEGRARDGAFLPLAEIASEALWADALGDALDRLLLHYRRHVQGMIKDDVALVLAAWSPEQPPDAAHMTTVGQSEASTRA